MAIKTVTIESILDGISQTQYVGAEGSFDSSIGIDPDFPVGYNTKTSGIIVPVVYEKFSGTEIDGYPMWIIPNTKTTNTYVYTTTGKVHSFDSTLSMRTSDEAATSLPYTLTGGAGNGAVYYNNFVYLAENTDISQIGPLSGGTVAETENVWTGAKFGSKAALTDTTYPSIRGVEIPNHPMHHHSDNCVYIGDVVAGQGVIHRLKTKKTTVEGDTDDTTVPSAFNALDLPHGFYPTDIESYGTDVIIAAIQSTDSTVNQGKAALFFWDPTNTDSFYRQVALPDPLVTALLNINGIIYIWSGNAQNGVRISRYIGGETVQEVVYLEEGAPPFAGAVDALGSRLSWGGYITYPEAAASVLSYGSKVDALPKGLNNIVRSTSTGANQNVTACKYIQQASNIAPRMIVGWGDDSAKGLDKLSSSGTYNSIWRSKITNIGKPFSINEIQIPLAGAVDANTSLTVKVYFDDLSDSITLTTVNNTNYPSKRKVKFKDIELNSKQGENNFLIEIEFNGTTQMPVQLPISVDVDINEAD